jgi:hypothetical protein
MQTLLSLGFIDYNPFQQKEILGRFSYILDFYHEVHGDAMTLDEFLKSIDQKAEEYYSQFFETDEYREQFAFEISAYGFYYELRLCVITDDESADLEELAIEVYDSDEDI